MRTRRGYGYAHRLTETQRHALDELLHQLPEAVPGRPEQASSTPGRWRWVASAVAVAVVLLWANGIRGLIGSDRQAPATLRALAEAAGRTADQSTTFRHTIDTVVFGRREECRFVAVESHLWVPGEKPAGAHLVIDVVEPSAAAGAAAGCVESTVPTPNVQPGRLFDGPTADPGATWAEVGGEVIDFPGFDDPWPDRPAEGDVRWQRLVEQLVGAGTGPAERAELLASAAKWPGAEPVPEVTADVTGRPGTTLRVPYPDGSAELTFDAGSGALLQRVIRPEKTFRVLVTVYLELSDKSPPR